MASESTTEQYEWSELAPSVGVAKTVADVDGTDVEALPPVARAVDADALNELLRGMRTGESAEVVVSFEYYGCHVSVSSSGWVDIER